MQRDRFLRLIIYNTHNLSLLICKYWFFPVYENIRAGECTSHISPARYDALMRIRARLFHGAVYHSVDDLFLADHIEYNNRDQCQQIGRERQVVVRTELRLECQLRQRQCVLSFS